MSAPAVPAAAVPPVAIPPEFCIVGEDSLLAWYGGLLAGGAISADAAQKAAVDLLQGFSNELTAAPPDSFSDKIRNFFGADAPSAAGVYLHGGVGRGKSFLMDGFYLQLPLQKKLRAHFHQFMRRLHGDMKAAEGEKDPLDFVARGLARRFSLICFDEFHISDITDAMLLGRLLEILLAENVRFVMTSNYPPAGLYPNGLARERFLPAIALLEKRFAVLSLDGDGEGGGDGDGGAGESGGDYRLQHLSREGTYFTDEGLMRRAFDRLACGIVLQNSIKLNGREVAVVARTSDCVWLTFAVLCEEARAAADYLQLAGRYGTVFLSGVPRLGGAGGADGDDLGEAARRFTWLVDVLYDNKINLILGAECALENLYGDGGDGGESGRTLSRLVEMQGAAYLESNMRAAAA